MIKRHLEDIAREAEREAERKKYAGIERGTYEADPAMRRSSSHPYSYEPKPPVAIDEDKLKLLLTMLPQGQDEETLWAKWPKKKEVEDVSWFCEELRKI